MYTRRILVDIDCLLDTRLGLVRTRYPEKMQHIDGELYHKRMSEIWAKAVGISDWDAEYAKRDVTVLANSRPTIFVDVLNEIIEQELIAIKLGQPTETPMLSINYAPYDLSPDERKEFGRAFSDIFPVIAVEVVNRPIKTLDPLTLARNWDCWFMYDWYEWIRINMAKLQNRIPKFVINRPALFTSEMTPEVAEALKELEGNPFDELKRAMAEFITIDTLDAIVFSEKLDQ